MTTKSAPPRSHRHRSATIQWVAIGVVIALAIIAAFVFFGEDGTGGGGGHAGLPALGLVAPLT